MFSALWRYRHFVLASISAELRGRFARSRLGFMWSILHPLAQATIFALVLSEVLGTKLGGVENKAAYPIYLMAGMAAWGLFSEIVNRCLSVFIEYSSALKKIAFPRICLPVIVWGSALLNHVLLLAAIIIVSVFFDHLPGIALLVLPLGIALISMFAFGLGVTLGIFNVFSRDVGQVVSVALQLWFWLTPVVYTRDMMPEHLRWLVDVNPIAALVGIYQDALLFDRWPDFSLLAGPAAVAAALFAMSFLLFRRVSGEIVDVL